MTVWFITGASRGFGAAITREALTRGHQVAATARDPDRIPAAPSGREGDLLPVRLDVTDPAAAERAVQQVLDRFGRIDVLVNNAGYGLVGAVEETSDAEARAMFDVNVFGLLTVSRAVLPVLRRQRSGTVINMLSSGGFNGRTGWGVYSATKFAVEGLSAAMRQELAPVGVRVTAIEPGGFRTDALDTASLVTAQRVIDDYAATAGAIRAGVADINHLQPGDPAKAASVIADLAAHPNPPERIQLGEICFDAVTDKLHRVAAEQAAWRDASLSTNY